MSNNNSKDDVAGEIPLQPAGGDKQHALAGALYDLVDAVKESKAVIHQTFQLSDEDVESGTTKTQTQTSPLEKAKSWFKESVGSVGSAIREPTNEEKAGPFFELFYFPIFVLFFIALLPYYSILSLSMLFTPCGLEALRVFIYGIMPRYYFKFQHARAQKSSFSRWALLGFGVIYPINFVVCGVILLTGLPLAVVGFHFLSILIALSICLLLRQSPRGIVLSMRQSADFLMRVIILSLFPTWDVQANLTDAIGFDSSSRLVLDPSTSAISLELISKNAPFLFSLTLFILGRFVTPIFNSVTDILFLEQLAQLQQGRAPISSIPFVDVMLALSVFATTINFAFHAFDLVRMSKQLFGVYQGKRTLDVVVRAYQIAGSELSRSDPASKLAPPVVMQVLKFFKLVCGDVLHILVSCLTLGFFGTTSVLWLINVITSAVSVSWFLSDIFMDAFYVRVIRGTLLRSVFRVCLLVMWGSGIAVVVALSSQHLISTSNVCSIPWTPSTLTDDVIGSLAAASCSSLAFPLVIANTTSFTNLNFNSLASVPAIVIADNSILQSISFTALSAPIFCCSPNNASTALSCNCFWPDNTTFVFYNNPVLTSLLIGNTNPCTNLLMCSE